MAWLLAAPGNCSSPCACCDLPANARGNQSSGGRIELASVCAVDSFRVRTRGLGQALRSHSACVRVLEDLGGPLAKQVQLSIKYTVCLARFGEP